MDSPLEKFPSSTSSSRHRSSVWSDHFSSRKPLPSAVQDERLPVRQNETAVHCFLTAGDNIFTPPCLNWRDLAIFLYSADLRDLIDSKRVPRPASPKLCLIDDRVIAFQEDDSHARVIGTVREDDGEPNDILNLDCFRKVLNERELYERLQESRAKTNAHRRVILITNLTPLCGLALAITASNQFSRTLKSFLMSYLIGEISLEAYAGPQQQMNPDSSYLFTMRFHLSYPALRAGRECSDPRGVRQSYSMIPPLDDFSDELFYYDAQTSFLMTGVDEWHWTAYCCVDTFFQSEQDVHGYLRQGTDGPSGGAWDHGQVSCSPRLYFLAVLSQRVVQITNEWGNTISVLMAHLDSYESFYIRTIDTDNLRDDASMTRTKIYTKAVSICHQFHDTLFATTESLQTFIDENCPFFDMYEDPKAQESANCISLHLVHLRRWQRRLDQRRQRFAGMKDGLVNSSALHESRRATKQGDDIGVLTNMTVAYLPFNLAAGIFSISTSAPRGLVWLYLTMTSLVLGLATFCFAFGRRFSRYWIERGGKRRK